MEKNGNHKISGKILIVDDELDICYLLSTFFKYENYHTEEAHSLEQAQIHLRENTPDLIFLDNHLPDGQGIKAVEQIRQKYPQTRIVVISAHDRSSDKALKSGADMFLPKPFTREQVTHAVHFLLRQAC